MNHARYHSGDVAKVCKAKLGAQFRKGGKELNADVFHDGRKVARITVPKGKKSLPPKTYSRMAQGLHLSTGQFDALMDCSLGPQGYGKIIDSLEE